MAYYAFDRDCNVEPLRFNPDLPLFWSLDFNIDLMCAIIGQRDRNRVYVLTELVLRDSNTWSACEAAEATQIVSAFATREGKY